MALPKRKISKQRKGERRANQALKLPTLVKDKESGKLTMPHHVSKQTGRYKNKEVVSID